VNDQSGQKVGYHQYPTFHLVSDSPLLIPFRHIKAARFCGLCLAVFPLNSLRKFARKSACRAMALLGSTKSKSKGKGWMMWTARRPLSLGARGAFRALLPNSGVAGEHQERKSGLLGRVVVFCAGTGAVTAKHLSPHAD